MKRFVFTGSEEGETLSFLDIIYSESSKQGTKLCLFFSLSLPNIYIFISAAKVAVGILYLYQSYAPRHGDHLRNIYRYKHDNLVLRECYLVLSCLLVFFYLTCAALKVRFLTGQTRRCHTRPAPSELEESKFISLNCIFFI